MSETRFQHAVALHAQGDLQSASDICLGILKQNPMHAEALHLTGVVACQIQNFPLAITFIERAIAIKPDYAEAFYSYDQATLACPDYANAWYNRDNALMDLKRYDEALHCYQRAADLGLDYSFLWGSIAQARAYLCDWSERSADQNKLRSIVAAFQQIPPFILLAMFDEPELHLAAARTYGENVSPSASPPPPAALPSN